MVPAADVDLTASFLSTSRSTSSSETLRQAKRWLSDCEKYHTLCSVPVWSAGRPPTRLLHIQHPDIVRLSTADHAGVVYATLSHCWGTSTIIKLATDSFTSFVEGVDISRFPKTFQHAIEVTRHLGIDHIWIDSCCIIQDSLDDWRTESANVGAIYTGSRLNLAATDSSDSSGGLFRNREPGSLSPCKINATETAFDTGEYYFLSPVAWKRDVHDARLNSRGWVFQERTLAPRDCILLKAKFTGSAGSPFLGKPCPKRYQNQIHLGLGTTANISSQRSTV
ncbi:HET-domain-containing protein [Canariomyces notabilis]|uniref:HET-domain-containing protein n=1 Tax=Canariomyces notabilis TaxID=2074819 RepID=A0AAN6QIW8_9PEZI|nr:HET-domain-containing protein [Canariomyces arenarius]